MRFIRPIMSMRRVTPIPRLAPTPIPTKAPIGVRYMPTGKGWGMSGLGDLGDDLSAPAAVPDLISKLKGFIINKAGVLATGSVAANQSLPAIIYAASDYYAKGNAGQLPPDAQTAWNAWKAQAEPAAAEPNIYWVLARCINRWGDKLIAAANEQASTGLLTDQAASKASFTLMDTTQQGTTWMGGTVTASKLSTQQWGAVFETAFNVIAKGVTGGVLPFTYLDVLVKAMCTDLVKRRFPVWAPPFTALQQGDPRGTAFRAMMKQLGWGSVTSLWFGYTQQAWATQNASDEQMDSALNSAVTALNYVSGKAVYDSILAKVQDYFKARSEARTAIQQFQQMQQGPLGSYVSAADIATMDKLKQQFAAGDNSVNSVLQPAGLWPSDTPAGLSFLGVAQYIVGGVVAVAILGMLVWGISLMTATTRSAAAQTKATADSILATIGDVKASCLREFEASAKTPADEAKMQACLLKTESLYKNIPTPPSGGDPLGLKWIALVGVVGIGGFLAYKQFGKK